jgi:hypothetical protein
MLLLGGPTERFGIFLGGYKGRRCRRTLAEGVNNTNMRTAFMTIDTSDSLFHAVRTASVQ